MELTAHTPRGVDKTTRYGWVTKDAPGQLMMLHKDLLRIHPAYQRAVVTGKVTTITAEWSWIGCGALVVGERDGEYWVIDGQHRALAAKRRSDIQTLPCVVFQTEDVKTEARGFLNLNTARKNVTVFAKHKAMLAAGDEIARYVESQCNEIGVSIVENAHTTGTLKSLGWCIRRANENKELFRLVLEFVAELCAKDQMPIPEKLLEGMWVLHAQCGDGLHDRRLVKRLREKGAKTLIDAAIRAASYYSTGGGKVYASGMLAEINKGLQKKFTMGAAE